MVSIAGATSAGPLLAQYSALGIAISQAQAAVAAGASLQAIDGRVMIGGNQSPMSANIPLSAADTATVLNGLISLWQAMQAAVAAQIAAIS